MFFAKNFEFLGFFLTKSVKKSIHH